MSKNTKIENRQDNIPDIPDKKPKGIPVELILSYAQKELSNNDIAALVGCSERNVYERLRPYKDKLKRFDKYKKYRADYFAFKGKEFLDSFNTEDIKKMPVASRVTCAAILYDKERLERGQSTENVAIHDIESNVADLRAKRQAIEAELKGESHGTSIIDGNEVKTGDIQARIAELEGELSLTPNSDDNTST